MIRPIGDAVAHASVNVALASRSGVGTLRADPARYCRQPTSAIQILHRDIWVHWEQTMSIFGKIMSAIFGTKADAAPAGGAAAPAGSSSGAAPAATVDVAPILDAA